MILILASCSFRGCSRTFVNFRTYQNHLLVHPRPRPDEDLQRILQRIEDESHHSGSIMEEPEASTTSDQHEAGATGFTAADMQMFDAKWILKTRETRNPTKTAMKGIIEDTSDMVAFATSTLKHKICVQLSSRGVDSNIITSLDTIFKILLAKIFDGISSFYQQIQYCRHHFNLVVSYKI